MVLCIDEKTQLQALGRTPPLLPIDFGATEERTHDYHRHGTTTLSVALEVANLSTHTTDDVTAWLAKHPRITFHFTPTGGSWLNMVEIWFGIIARQAIRRGTLTSLRQLLHAIEDYAAAWNTDAKPFTWTANADEILAKVRWVHTEVRKLLANNSKCTNSIARH